MNNYNKFVTIISGALLFGFGWHIRGSGTSDPTVAMLLLLLFLSIVFGPRKKFNSYIFGIIIILFRVMRRGWETFVGQAGIPRIYKFGHYASFDEDFDVFVAWRQDYFWLFIVGIAWSGLAALFMGRYMFVQKNQHRPYDFWISLVIFLIGWGLGLLAARAITPHISLEAYQVYIDGISERNYISMWDNCAFEFGIIPVLIYLGFAGKEWKSLLELNQ